MEYNVSPAIRFEGPGDPVIVSYFYRFIQGLHPDATKYASLEIRYGITKYHIKMILTLGGRFFFRVLSPGNPRMLLLLARQLQFIKTYLYNKLMEQTITLSSQVARADNYNNTPSDFTTVFDRPITLDRNKKRIYRPKRNKHDGTIHGTMLAKNIIMI